jgi:hypothetical protein
MSPIHSIQYLKHTLFRLNSSRGGPFRTALFNRATNYLHGKLGPVTSSHYTNSTVKRPKSDGRCIHCRQKMEKDSETADHVFPSSWYPDTTPETVQRWTVPSCAKCNREIGEKEKQVLIRVALCINPTKPEALGILKRAYRSLGIGVTDVDADEMKIRKTLKEEVLKDAQLYSGNPKENIIPGLGPHPEVPHDQQYEIGISADDLIDVVKKIVRGFEYWLGGGRIIDPPHEIDVFTLHEKDIPSAFTALLATTGKAELGPGVRVRRGAAVDGSGAVLYEVVIWDTMKFLCSILPPENAEESMPSPQLANGC